MSLCNREASVVRPSVCLSVCKLFCANRFFYQEMAGSPPNLHTMVPRRARIQDVLKVKVKVKGHVIRALLWCHEMFAIQYGLTFFCLYMRLLYETPFLLQYKYQAARCLDTGMSYSVIDGLVYTLAYGLLSVSHSWPYKSCSGVCSVNCTCYAVSAWANKDR